MPDWQNPTPKKSDEGVSGAAPRRPAGLNGSARRMPSARPKSGSDSPERGRGEKAARAEATTRGNQWP